MDEVTAPVAGTEAGQDLNQTTPPASAANAAVGANTAPAPKETAREAYARLERGESPDQVNRELYQKAPAAPARTPAAGAKDGTSSATPAAKDGSAGAADNAGAADQASPDNITPEDLQVLRRAKFDLNVWKHIPPSNRRAVVNNFKTQQAEADRQFQRARGNASPPTPSQTQTGRQDGATQTADEQVDDEGQQLAPPNGGQQQQAPAAASQQQQAALHAQQAAAGVPAIDVSKLIDAKDLETLRTLGGDELADVHSRGIANAVNHVLQQVAPQTQALSWLLGHVEETEFRTAIDQLKSQPGFETLTDEQVAKVRERSNHLIRAAGDLGNYRHAQGVSDAAASLFRTNVQQAVQANLLRGRQASLQGSAERGTGRIPAQRPLSGKERDAAIFEKLSEGLNPSEARRAVDGR